MARNDPIPAHVSRVDVERQLERILESPPFRTSPRSSLFLRHLVERTLEGRQDVLHERLLGIDIFGREPSYDTGEDSVVRVKATDVRKRLAQYYVEHDDELKIQILPGTYIPEFIPSPDRLSPRPDPSVVPEAPPARPQPRALRFLVLGAIAGIAATAFVVWMARLTAKAPGTIVDEFWEPVLSSPRDVVFSLGRTPVYVVDNPVVRRYFETHLPPNDPPPYSLPHDPELVVRGSELLSEQGQFVGVGVSDAMLSIATFLAKRNRTSFLRAGTELGFAELQQHPAVLIGAHSNYLTMHFAQSLPFYFTEDQQHKLLVDRQDPKRVFVEQYPVAGSDTSVLDYAMACRLKTSGQPVIIAAGLLQYGCRAAAQVLTDPKLLTAALRQAPAGWRNMNIQIILSVKVVNRTGGVPEIIETRFW